MKYKLQILITFIFLGFTAWWASFQHGVQGQGLAVQWFGGSYGIMALIGSIIGFFAAHKWGGFKTTLGKALTFFSLGLIAQEIGQLIYTYYVYVAKVEEIPYPSLGDVAYFGSVLLYICAVYFLTKVAGIQFSLKNIKYRLIAALIPAILLVLSYGVLLHNHTYDFSKPLTVFLDFGYPVTQALYISIAITAYLLSRRLLGGIMKRGILLVIVALSIQYIADFTFIYQNSRDTYLPGKFADLLYLTAYFAMAMALIKFYLIYKNLKTASVLSQSSPSSTTKSSTGS